jgi:hypothetical protein
MAAADYLGWPRERVYRDPHELPHRRHGNRPTLRRVELDECLEKGLRHWGERLDSPAWPR